MRVNPGEFLLSAIFFHQLLPWHLGPPGPMLTIHLYVMDALDCTVGALHMTTPAEPSIYIYIYFFFFFIKILHCILCLLCRYEFLLRKAAELKALPFQHLTSMTCVGVEKGQCVHRCLVHFHVFQGLPESHIHWWILGGTGTLAGDTAIPELSLPAMSFGIHSRMKDFASWGGNGFHLAKSPAENGSHVLKSEPFKKWQKNMSCVSVSHKGTIKNLDNRSRQQSSVCSTLL